MKKSLLKSLLISSFCWRPMRHFVAVCATQLLTSNFILFAQAPQRLSYQAEIRNASNALVVNTLVGMRFSILQGSATGTVVYSERQTPTTNSNGLVSLQIGGGTVISGVFASIAWGSGTYFLKTETDPVGGTNYTISGTQQMLSVPYALYANAASTATSATTAGSANTATTAANGVPTGGNEGQVLTRCGGVAIWTTSGICPGTITALTCASATNTGTLASGVAGSGVSSSVPYTGGNGGPYSGQTVISTGVTGLTATLPAGNFANGAGNLTYTITGTPALGGTASFALNIGGKTCVLTRTVPGVITALTCSTATNTGTLASGTAATGVSSSVPYTGGNGGPHSGQTITSTGVTGLTATLAAGNFVSGAGTLNYTITGTPAAGGTASFALNIGGQICTLTRIVPGAITALDCSTATNSGSLTAGIVASAVSSSVPYTGGNGGSHSGQTVTSTGVTGLTATLAAGTFASGSGSLIYTIIGTPATSGTASFALNIGGKTCSLTRTVLPVGAVTALNCLAVTNTGTLSSGAAASGVSSSVPYTGGNGGPHSGQTVISTGVTGLTATLAAGNFAVGAGSLTYNISGTPAAGGTAAFALNIGGKTCTLNLTIPGKITTLTCASATNTGTLASGVAASGVSSSVPYTGGNGGPHSGQIVTSTGVSGLTATLAAGSFVSGSGSLIYTITGTPAAGGTASFALNIGGKTCTITFTVPGAITALSCATATNSGTLISGTSASAVSSTIPYTGGNGGTYTAQSVSSTGVTGLTATLSAGNFATGAGSLSYTITGTPALSGTASFALNIGGQTCTLTRSVISLPVLSTTAAASITTLSAISGGNIATDGGSPVSARGVCWATTSSPTIALTTKTSDGTGTGSFVSSLTGLTANRVYYIRAYATNAAGTAYGAAVSFTTAAATVSDADGNVYNAVTIGNQVWMKENLKVSKYRNGNAIPTGLTNQDWIIATNTSGAYTVYDNLAANNTTYGKLYNWYAAADPRGLCPVGWHVPTDHDWNILTIHLDPAADTIGYPTSSTIAGGSMKAVSSLWVSPNTGANNSSGFSALPGGYREDYGPFTLIGFYGVWWSSTGLASQALSRDLVTNNGILGRNYVFYKTQAFSVRCLRD